MADIKLSSRRCEEIKKTVVEMFVEYDVSCVPINGFEIASKKGISVIPYSAFSPSKRTLLLKKSEDGFFGQLQGQFFVIGHQHGSFRIVMLQNRVCVFCDSHDIFLPWCGSKVYVRFSRCCRFADGRSAKVPEFRRKNEAEKQKPPSKE